MAFEKGQSGNPGGRVKDKPFRTALMMALKDAGEDMPALRDVAVMLVNKAREGDIQAIKELSDRLDGKPAQESTLKGDPEAPLFPATKEQRDASVDNYMKSVAYDKPNT